jgi:hypothetical protein
MLDPILKSGLTMIFEISENLKKRALPRFFQFFGDFRDF